MESAPLTLAHTHARNAVLETKRSNPLAASEEHDLAATEFAAAAQSTSDYEALRILNLLEQHHKKLANLLKSGPSRPTYQETSSDARPSSQDSSKVRHMADSKEGSSVGVVSQPPRLLHTTRVPARELSSSIASNLASARGIPNHRSKRATPISPLVSNQYADGQFAQDEIVAKINTRQSISPYHEDKKQDSTRPSWAPPADLGLENPNTTDNKAPIDTTTSDAPFQQFYSTFEGLLSKLSAPLAFAGLPLTTPAPAPQISSQPPKANSGIKQRANDALQSSMDYSQLISRAALRAVRKDNSRSPHNPSESFYVVPTSGGTTSYAEIMSRAEREESRASRDHRRNTSNVSNDDFVDASSTILPSPTLSKFGRQKDEQKVDGKTLEELALENNALKHLSDTLSKRLHVFEMSAQTSSAALAQSIRSLHLSPMGTPENSRGKSRTTSALSPDQIQGATSAAEAQRLNSRIAELEEILKKSDAKMKKRDEENAKLRDMLVKYRDKWEGLKASAKAKREKQTQGDGTRRREKGKVTDEGASSGAAEKTKQEDDQDITDL